MTCVQCGQACFLAGSGGGESCSGGGGVCVSGGGGGRVTSQIFVRGVPLKPLKYTHFIILKGQVLDQHL